MALVFILAMTRVRDYHMQSTIHAEEICITDSVKRVITK